eukprot:5048585-Ditylum_brightwellii.AAC.1
MNNKNSDEKIKTVVLETPYESDWSDNEIWDMEMVDGDVWEEKTVDGDEEMNVNLLQLATELENAATGMTCEILMRNFLPQ